MTKYDYLIVGGGMTGAAAAEGIREIDETGSIAIISAEADRPYNRPPLSKALWKGESIDTIWRKTEAQSVELHLGCDIRAVLPKEQRAIDSGGNIFAYQKLLLATGGTPRRLPFGGNEIVYFRTVSDYRRLRELADQGDRFAVIGGGFIGSEIAAALAANGKHVTLIFPGEEIGERVFPRDLARFVSSVYDQHGVELVRGEKAISLDRRNGERVVTLQSGRQIAVDGVVAGIGIQPNNELAKAAGVSINNGVIVDEFLRTDVPNIFAAGDVAEFYNPALGKRIRVEHEDNANSMGRAAGRNMAGKLDRYDHLPSFYSDMFELGYEAVGELDPKLETVADWKRPNEEGVVYYLKDGRVRGVLLWNVWGKVDAARGLIAEAGPFTAENLKGRL